MQFLKIQDTVINLNQVTCFSRLENYIKIDFNNGDKLAVKHDDEAICKINFENLIKELRK